MQARFKDYTEALLRNVDLFKPPSSASRAAIEQEPSLCMGSKKIPVAAELRRPALELSTILVMPKLDSRALAGLHAPPCLHFPQIIA